MNIILYRILTNISFESSIVSLLISMEEFILDINEYIEIIICNDMKFLIICFFGNDVTLKLNNKELKVNNLNC